MFRSSGIRHTGKLAGWREFLRRFKKPISSSPLENVRQSEGGSCRAWRVRRWSSSSSSARRSATVCRRGFMMLLRARQSNDQALPRPGSLRAATPSNKTILRQEGEGLLHDSLQKSGKRPTVKPAFEGSFILRSNPHSCQRVDTRWLLHKSIRGSASPADAAIMPGSLASIDFLKLCKSRGFYELL